MTSSRSRHRSWTTWYGSKTATVALPSLAPRPSGLLASIGILAVACWTSGCATAPAKPATPDKAPEASAAPAVTPVPTATPETPAAEPVKARPASSTDDPLVVVSQGGEPEAPATPAPRTLAEASRAERERRAKSGRPLVKINDKNLSRHATGSLTVMEPEERPAGGEEGVKGQDEAYWRERGLEIRKRWRQTSDEVKALEQSTADWRQRFYATDDPYVRDTRVKPEWDRALDRLGQARMEVEAAKKELAAFLEEGRRAGALPGWLRAGADQEPKDEGPKPSIAEPQEPQILGEKNKS